MEQTRLLVFGKNQGTESFFINSVGTDDFCVTAPLKVMHRQDGYTIHFVVRGHGELHLGEKTYYPHMGDVFFIPPNEPMMYYPAPEDPWKYYWFYLYGEQVPHLAQKMGFAPDTPVLSCRGCAVWERMAEELFAAGGSADGGYFAALSLLMRLAADVCPQGKGEPRRNTEDIPKQVRTLIALNYSNPMFGIEELTSMIHVSHSYLCRLFREDMGMSPVHYLTLMRLRAAATEIRNGEKKTVHELCRLAGFRDDIHFLKTFKRHYGMTVGEYRAAGKDIPIHEP